MRTATIHELKQELMHIPAPKMLEICLRLAKFKKENKELLTFLLFESHHLEEYIEDTKMEMRKQFDAVNLHHFYLAKKTIRKVLRTVNKCIRYTASKQTEVECLLYFCSLLKESPLDFKKSPVLKNIYENQLKKIKAAINTLHEDLQYDYWKAYNQLS